MNSMQSCDTNKKKIKGATRKNGEVDGTCRRAFTVATLNGHYAYS